MGASSSTDAPPDALTHLSRDIITRSDADSLEVLLGYMGSDRVFFQQEVARYNGIRESISSFRSGPVRLLSEDTNKVIDQLAALMQVYKRALIMHMKTYILCRSLVPRVIDAGSSYALLVTRFLQGVTSNMKTQARTMDEERARSERLLAQAVKLQREGQAGEEKIRREVATLKRLVAEVEGGPGRR